MWFMTCMRGKMGRARELRKERKEISVTCISYTVLYIHEALHYTHWVSFSIIDECFH